VDDADSQWYWIPNDRTGAIGWRIGDSTGRVSEENGQVDDNGFVNQDIEDSLLRGLCMLWWLENCDDYMKEYQ